MPAMPTGAHRPGRGADPDPVRRAGRADHDPVGEDAAGPRARHRGAGRARASTSSPPPTTATAASTSCPRALRRRFNTVVLPLPATAEEEVEIVARRVADLGRALELPEVPGRRRRDPPGGHGLPRAARRASTADGRTTLKSPVGHAVDAEAISVRHQRPRAGRALRRRRAARRATSPPASSARSSRTRSPTGSCGRSTWRRWSGSAPAGATSTGPAARSDDARDVGCRPVAERRRCSASGTTGPGSARSRACAALDRLQPDVRADRGAAEADALVRAGRRRRHGAAGRAARLRRRRRRAGPRSGRSRCSRPSGRRSAGPPRTASPVRFFDLPSSVPLAAWRGGRARPGGRPPPGRRRGRTWTGRRPLSRPRLDPIALLAAAAGYDDPERWWEDVIEHRLDGPSPFAALAEAMAALRADGPARPGEPARRGSVREAHMRPGAPGAR